MGNSKMRKLLCHGLAFAMVMSMTEMVAESSDAASKKAKLAKSSLTVEVGAYKKITIKNKVKKAKYTFKASNKKIKVSSAGKVKGVKVGSAKVTVKEKLKKKTRKVGTVSVKVKKAATKNKATATPNNTVVFTAIATPVATATATPIVTATATATATAKPTATPKPTATNLYESYFEDGDPNGFVKRGDDSVTIEISNSENHTASGMNSLHCKGRSATWHGVMLPIASYVKTSLKYDFSVWVMQKTGSEQNIALKAQYKDATNEDQFVNISKDTACKSGEWVNLKGSYEIPVNNGDIAIYIECSTSDTADFYVDDVTIFGMPENGESFSPDAQTYRSMVEGGVYSTGNNARIKEVLRRARAGEDVSLAYIGGSITEGGGYNPNSACYAEVSATSFAQKYGVAEEENVHFINAGMSGTPSDIGVVRYERDVLSRLPEGSTHPDILFIEFAVNDSGCETGGGAYEGLIRQALDSGSAVVLIFSVFNNLNRVCEMDYRKYGEAYDVPMISTADAIKGVYKHKGFYKWFYNDTLHPNKNGYKLMADLIMELMAKIDKEEAEEDNIKDIASINPVKSDAFQGIKLLDSSTEVVSGGAITAIELGGFNKKDSSIPTFQYKYNGQSGAQWFPNNWLHDKDSSNEPLTINVKCKTLMLVHKESSESVYGAADLYVDGEKKATLNCHNKSGWNNGKVCVAIQEDEVKEHRIELKMAEGNESKKFTLYAIGYK